MGSVGAGAGIGRAGARCPVCCPSPAKCPPSPPSPPIGPDAGSLAADWLAPVSSPHAITHLDPHFGLLALYPRLVLQRRTSFHFTKGSQALVGLTESGDFGCICTSTSTLYLPA